MKKKVPIVLIIFVAVIIIVNSVEFFFFKKADKEIADKKLNIEGKIKLTKELKYGHNYGYCLIEMEKTNCDFYDYREEKKDFFLIIKNNKCLIISPSVSSLNCGDSVSIDREKFSSFRDKKVVSEFSLTTLPSVLLDDVGNMID